jgi:hypothetical protein
MWLFAYRLAREFGYLDIDEMLESISAEQLRGWINYYQLEIFGYEIENYRSGIIASAIYNVNRQSTSDKIWKPSDFFMFHKPIVQQSDEELLSMGHFIADIYNHK